MITDTVMSNAATIRGEYAEAKPFKHVCIENFLETPHAEKLLADFPRFDPDAALNEFGERAGKQIVTNIATISPFYSQFFDYMRSPEFLNAMSTLTGIPDLLFDDKMFGGGTHENVNGQELDPHVDFNYDQQNGWHRRLNALLYLNKHWESDWGGCIELHKNPRLGTKDQTVEFLPLFNRMVIFETNEISWHGFRKISLPPEQKANSRKCISIYLYTKTRPPEETAPPHSTFYVQRPLPSKFVAGHKLTDDEINELRQSFGLRDRWIELYQKAELRHSATIQGQHRMLQELRAAIRLPMKTNVVQEPGSTGIFHDGWLGPETSLAFRSDSPIEQITLRGQFFQGTTLKSADLRVDAGVLKSKWTYEDDCLKFRPEVPLVGSFTLELAFTKPSERAVNDEREICFHVHDASFKLID